MRVEAIIIARGGSKGIPKKNIINFCGSPLITWTIKQCLASSKISNVWVSSDSDEILEISKGCGAKLIRRPVNISGDGESSESAWLHAIDFIENEIGGAKIDYVVAPQVTSPLREVSDFDRSIVQIISDHSDSLFSANEIEDFFIWIKLDGKNPESVNYNYKNRKPRQKIGKKYLENGSFYIFKPTVLKENNNRLGGVISYFIMDKHKMFQIDNYVDVKLSSIIMKEYKLDNL